MQQIKMRVLRPFVSHPGFGKLLDLLNFLVGQDVKVAYDVGAIPLILLLHWLQEETRVPVTIPVATEQAAAPCIGLVEKSK